MKRRNELGVLHSRSGRYALISEACCVRAPSTGFLFFDGNMGHDARLLMRPGEAPGTGADSDENAGGDAR
jgi:hypothetical protein